MGEALCQAQRVVAERDALSTLLVGGVGGRLRPGGGRPDVLTGSPRRTPSGWRPWASRPDRPAIPAGTRSQRPPERAVPQACRRRRWPPRRDAWSGAGEHRDSSTELTAEISSAGAVCCPASRSGRSGRRAGRPAGPVRQDEAPRPGSTSGEQSERPDATARPIRRRRALPGHGLSSRGARWVPYPLGRCPPGTRQVTPTGADCGARRAVGRGARTPPVSTTGPPQQARRSPPCGRRLADLDVGQAVGRDQDRRPCSSVRVSSLEACPPAPRPRRSRPPRRSARSPKRSRGARAARRS